MFQLTTKRFKFTEFVTDMHGGLKQFNKIETIEKKTNPKQLKKQKLKRVNQNKAKRK